MNDSIQFPQPDHGLYYTAPAATWDEALPLGNGIMGALVWGDGRPLRLSLDRTDLWDLRPVPEFHSPEYTYRQMIEWHRAGRHDDLVRLYEAPYSYRPAPTKIPAGRIEIALGPTADFVEAALDLRAARASARFAGGAQVTAFLHALAPVGMLEARGAGDPQVELLAPPFGGAVATAADNQIRAGDLAQLGYPPPESLSGSNWRAFHQRGAQGFHFAVHVAWRKREGRWELAWSIASSFEGDDPLDIARVRAEAALDTGFERMSVSHTAWWERYWRQSSIELPNPVVERQWYLEQYKFGAASPARLPAHHAARAVDGRRRQLCRRGRATTITTSTRSLSYWPCYSGNHLEEGLSYLDWLWETRPACFEWTRRFFGLPGLNVPMTADLNSNQIGGWRQYTHSATTAAWLAHHFYLHWRYSADRAFLRERAYPYLQDAADVRRGGHGAARRATASGHCRSAPRPRSTTTGLRPGSPRSTNYDLALMRWLFGSDRRTGGRARVEPRRRGALAGSPG